MNDKAVWSQSASYAGMWHSNPPSLLPQREVSKLQKKGGGGKGGGWCMQVFNNKCSDLSPGSQPISLRQAGGKARGRKIWDFPKATCNSPDSEGSERSRLWGSSTCWVGAAERAPWGLTPARVGRF